MDLESSRIQATEDAKRLRKEAKDNLITAKVSKRNYFGNIKTQQCKKLMNETIEHFYSRTPKNGYNNIYQSETAKDHFSTRTKFGLCRSLINGEAFYIKPIDLNELKRSLKRKLCTLDNVINLQLIQEFRRIEINIGARQIGGGPTETLIGKTLREINLDVEDVRKKINRIFKNQITFEGSVPEPFYDARTKTKMMVVKIERIVTPNYARLMAGFKSLDTTVTPFEKQRDEIARLYSEFLSIPDSEIETDDSEINTVDISELITVRDDAYSFSITDKEITYSLYHSDVWSFIKFCETKGKKFECVRTVKQYAKRIGIPIFSEALNATLSLNEGKTYQMFRISYIKDLKTNRFRITLNVVKGMISNNFTIGSLAYKKKYQDFENFIFENFIHELGRKFDILDTLKQHKTMVYCNTILTNYAIQIHFNKKTPVSIFEGRHTENLFSHNSRKRFRSYIKKMNYAPEFFLTYPEIDLKFYEIGSIYGSPMRKFSSLAFQMIYWGNYSDWEKYSSVDGLNYLNQKELLERSVSTQWNARSNAEYTGPIMKSKIGIDLAKEKMVVYSTFDLSLQDYVFDSKLAELINSKKIKKGISTVKLASDQKINLVDHINLDRNSVTELETEYKQIIQFALDNPETSFFYCEFESYNRINEIIQELKFREIKNLKIQPETRIDF